MRFLDDFDRADGQLSGEPMWSTAGVTTDGATIYLAPAGTQPPPGVEAARIDIRKILGIPPGFPLWYQPPRPALPAGPIGRQMMRTQLFLQRVAIVTAERWPLPDDPLDPSTWFGDEPEGDATDDDR